MAYHAKGLEELGYVFEKDFYTLEKRGVVELVWKSSDPEPTLEECEAAYAQWANKEYQRTRAAAYASTGDQLDMQYWDNVNGTTTWKDHVTAIKAAHPKP